MIKIVTDATNDLSLEFLKENNIELIPMNLNIPAPSSFQGHSWCARQCAEPL